jgi:hypothetical protein
MAMELALHEKRNVADKLLTLPEANGREKATAPVSYSGTPSMVLY